MKELLKKIINVDVEKTLYMSRVVVYVRVNLLFWKGTVWTVNLSRPIASNDTPVTFE